MLKVLNSPFKFEFASAKDLRLVLVALVLVVLVLLRCIMQSHLLILLQQLRAATFHKEPDVHFQLRFF